MSGRMLEGVYGEVAEANSKDDFRRTLMKFAASHDFGSSSVSTIIDLPFRGVNSESVVDIPEKYLKVFNDASGAKLDPVMQSIKKSSIPLVWDSRTYFNASQQEVWDFMSDCGLKSGIAFAIHLPGGRHLAFGFDAPRVVPRRNKGQLQALLGELQLFGAHAIEPAFRLFPPVQPPTILNEYRLTSRELEILKWTVEGKSAWEIGIILSISSRTVVKHASSACLKLECVSKQQAAIKAIRMGLIK